MNNEYICPVCEPKKKFKNENGLRGHLQLKRDDEHQQALKAFQERKQRSDSTGAPTTHLAPSDEPPQLPPAVAPINEPSVETQPEKQVDTTSPPAGEITQPPEQRVYPSIITTTEPTTWGEVPLYEEKSTAPASALTAEDVRRITQAEIQRGVSQQVKPVARQVERPTAPLDVEELEPYEWFKWFLNEKPRRYGLNEKTIELLADRVQLRRGELPQPAQFQKDVPRFQKSITAETAAGMAEAYLFALQKYQESRRRRAEYYQQEYQGIRMPEVKPPTQYGDIRTQQIIPGQQHYPGSMIPVTQQTNPYLQQTIPPVQPYDPSQAYLEQQVAQQVQKYWQLQNTMNQQNPLQKDVEELKIELKERDKLDRDRLYKEVDESKRDRDHYAELAKKHEDDKRRMEMDYIRAGNQPATTSTTVELERLNKNHELDMQKQASDAEFKQTLAEEIPGAATEITRGFVDGIKEFNKGKEMQNTPGAIPSGGLWQSPCPNPECDALISAPVGQTRVHCAKCGEWFETVPHDSNRGSFSVQQPQSPVDTLSGIRHQPPPKEATFEAETMNPTPENNPNVPADEPTNEQASPEPPPDLPLRPDTGRTATTAPENKKETPPEKKKEK